MFTFDQAMRLSRLQQRIWNALAEALREDGHRKSSDGAIELTFSMPAAFDNSPPRWMLTIWSYVLCEKGRRKSFDAPSIEGVLSMAESYANSICMPWEFRAMDREWNSPDDDEREDVPFTAPTGRPDEEEIAF